MNQPKPYTAEGLHASAPLSDQLNEVITLLKEIRDEFHRREDEHQRTTVADQCRNMTILSIKESVGISNRTIRILEKKKICSIHEFLTYKEEEIRNINGLGCQSWLEIKRLIAYLNRYFNGGISLGMFNKNL